MVQLDVPAPPRALAVAGGAPAPAPGRPGPHARRRPRDASGEQRLSLCGAALSALGLTWVGYERVLPLSGTAGFWVCWYVAFLVLYAALVVQQSGQRALADRLATVLFTSAAVVVVGVLALVVGYTAFRGYRALHVNFFTSTMSLTGPLDPLTSGGALHAMVGSLEQVGLGVLVTVPLGITAALYLNEVRGPIARPVRMIVDAMSALPSIVAGLFVLAAVVLTLGFTKSGFAAALAISVMMFPIVTRASEVVLRLVPGGLREASLALGASQWRTVWNVVLPTARSGLATAILLGVARGVGETAPVLLTSGFTAEMNANPFRGAQVSLPLYIYSYVRLPQKTLITRGYGAALALLLIVLVLFVTARLLGGQGPGQLTRRQRRRLARGAQPPEPSIVATAAL